MSAIRENCVLSAIDLLHRIQEQSMSSTTPVSELLRRAQLFAARAAVPDLKEWVELELNGYPGKSHLPHYRIMHGVARGHFLRPYGGGGLKNVVLPAGNLPENLRDWARKAYIREPIATIESVASGDTDAVYYPWPGDVIATVRDCFYENMYLVQATLETSRTGFVGAVEAVRNRLLSFSIQAEELFGASTETTPPSAALTTIFQTHIYGDVTNLAQGSSHVVQSSGIAVGDFTSLVRELRSLGIEGSDIDSLQTVVHDDSRSSEDARSRVAKWTGMILSKALSGAGKVSVQTASTVIPKLIEQYLGIG